MSARRFREQRIMIILMFRTWGNLEANYQPTTPPAISWPATCSYFSLIPFRSRMFRPGQASRRQTSFTFFPLHIAASILGLRTKSRLLLNLRHVPCNLIICNACSLPGNRRARSYFFAYSSPISGSLNILVSPWINLIDRCVPARCAVPSGRSNITSHYRPQAVQSLPLLR
jgi:hypothetical protein